MHHELNRVKTGTLDKVAFYILGAFKVEVLRNSTPVVVRSISPSPAAASCIPSATQPHPVRYPLDVTVLLT